MGRVKELMDFKTKFQYTRSHEKEIDCNEITIS